MLKKLNLKRHALTGISYMIPVVVAGGLCMGLAKVFGGWDIAAGIAYSISGRPGIAPGLAPWYF